MAVLESPGVALFGVAATAALFVAVRRDASRVGMSRSLLWAVAAAVPVLVGFGMYLYVPAVPMTGVIMTANTGLVVYGLEREVSTEEEIPADPGSLPNRK
ncbi:hypothetical protein GRS48_02070 [Halorubrum sp. JWXQ-INN 858]|uniref:hypothetical protein n=1 Tax=Halorubrum sp. JWXQ-INN 858 TaxID=2690782 RepID=UPI00135C3B70|nr:hypothetical protein [Halorubrum sp. JWXQ-INN 858]MWV63614.1 hypothetical protein [Halorubrum sp. JWXQ-INN 858]